MKDPGQYRAEASWIDGLLSEDAQRSFLVGSGCIIFLLAAVVLSLDDPKVPHEIRVYAWPEQAPDSPVQLRAVGFDKRTHRFESVGLCEDSATRASSVRALPDQGEYALPLLLEASPDLHEVELCLKIPSWEERRLLIPLAPVAPGKDGATRRATRTAIRDTEVFAADSSRSFPFAHVAVPAEGVYNPMNPNAELLFWLDRQEEKVRHMISPKNFVEVQHISNGLYRIPIENRGLIGKTVVQVESEGKFYTRTFQFHPRARRVTLDAQRDGDSVTFVLRRVQQETSRAHDHGASAIVELTCSLMTGAAALRSVTLRIDAKSPLISHEFPWKYSPNELLGVICDPNPLGGDSDAVSTLALPTNHASPDPSLIDLARLSLPRLMHRPMARRVLSWYRDGTPEERARALEILLATLQPAPIEMRSVASSYPADIERVTSRHASVRNRIFGVLGFLLALWLLLMIATLIQRQNIRTQAIAHYLADDPDEEVAAAMMSSGRDALARPHSSLLALSMVAVLLLHILGLLWVLWNL